MTRAEHDHLMNRIAAAWPRQRLTPETRLQWWRRLRFFNHDTLSLALANLLQREHFMPSLAMIVYEARRIEASARPIECLVDNPDALGHEGLAARAREYLAEMRRSRIAVDELTQLGQEMGFYDEETA